MMEDVVRLDKRVGKLESHFDQASRDIQDIRTSANKIVSRGEKIGEVGNSGGSYGSHLHFERRIHRGATVRRARFNGQSAYYFGTRRYKSRNCR